MHRAKRAVHSTASGNHLPLKVGDIIKTKASSKNWSFDFRGVIAIYVGPDQHDNCNFRFIGGAPAEWHNKEGFMLTMNSWNDIKVIGHAEGI